MYKLLFVDDEIVVREGIKSVICWHDLDIDLIGVAENGEEALPIALKEKPDIVITDILMPFMDGLELAKRLKEVLPETKVIILSGYKEFAYAQKAIEYKVHSYLLKPIIPDDLVNMIKGVADEIQRERSVSKSKPDLVGTGLDFNLFLEEMNSIKTALKLGDKVQIKNAMDSVFSVMEGNSPMPVSLKFIANGILNLGYKTYEELSCGNSEIRLNRGQLKENLEACLAVQELKLYLEDFLIKITSEIAYEKACRDKIIVAKCKAFIHDKHKHINLSINDIAAKVHLSPGYLSQLFRKETGESINNYIINARLEHAKELLASTDKTLYEIACDVGYADEFYLSNAFKKYIGLRPSDYRKEYFSKMAHRQKEHE